jgi:hypothetical protein
MAAKTNEEQNEGLIGYPQGNYRNWANFE